MTRSILFVGVEALLCGLKIVLPNFEHISVSPFRLLRAIMCNCGMCLGLLMTEPCNVFAETELLFQCEGAVLAGMGNMCLPQSRVS